MKINKIIDVKTVVILVLLFLLALSWGKRPHVSNDINVIDSIAWNIKDSLMIRDTLIVKDTLIPKYVSIPIYDTIAIDTSKIVADYFRKKIYLDTLINDTSALFVLNQTVWQNKLFNTSFTFVNKLPQYRIVTKTNHVTQPVFKPRFLLGAQFTTNSDLYLTGLYVTKYKGAYSFGYDPMNKRYSLGVYFKLF